MNPLFANTSPGFKFFIFLGLLLFGAILGMLLGLLIVVLFYQVPLDQINISAGGEAGLQIARILQISGQFGLFFIPPIGFALLVGFRPFKEIGFMRISHFGILLAGLAIMYAALPLIHFLSEWNAQLSLPDSLSGFEDWMLKKEEEAALLSERFLAVDSISALGINLFMIAVLPAVGEEMVFRGVLQPLFIRMSKNVHVGIFIAALVFGVMHLQFYGLMPRIMLGLFLGYFFYFSGSLWVPILMHLLNNGTAVIVYYLHHNGYIQVEMEHFGSVQNPIYIGLSFIAVSGLIFYAWVIKSNSRSA